MLNYSSVCYSIILAKANHETKFSVLFGLYEATFFYAYVATLFDVVE